MGSRYSGGKVPAATVDEDPERTLRAEWEKFSSEIYPLCDGFQFHALLEQLNVFVKAVNRYLDVRSPWKLAKSADPADQARVATSLAYLAESVRLGAATSRRLCRKFPRAFSACLDSHPWKKWEGQLTWGDAARWGASWAKR